MQIARFDNPWVEKQATVYDINCGSGSGFRAVPLEQEVLLLSKKSMI